MNTLRLRLRRLLDRGERRKQRRRKRSGRAYHLDIIQGPLSVFRIASSNYWRYPELTYRSANLFPSQLCELLSRLGLLGTNAVIDMATFVADVGGDTDASQLGKLFSAYGSDKERHGYHIAYAAILSLLRRNEPLTILEIGLGTNNSKLVSSMGSGGTPGASLRAFRDFLPTSTICGADVDRSILFHEERIKTAHVDQTCLQTFDDLAAALGIDAFDLIIDDGLHSVEANLNTLIFALNKLRLGGWIAIEDIPDEAVVVWRSLVGLLNRSNFKAWLIKAHVHNMVVAMRSR